MTKIFKPISFVLLSLMCCNQCLAQKTSDGNWTVLFNGKDLTGWEMRNANHKAEVKNGVIVATNVIGEDNGFLCTTKQYGDFILELEVNGDLLLDNSGIQYRSASTPDFMNGRVHGYQVQIENRPPHISQWSGSIYDEAGRGFLYIFEDDPVRQKAYVQNQWNKVRIEAIGTTSRVWINGIPTAHVVDDKMLSGLICLQVHGGSHADERGEQSVYMRNVRIQTENLKPSPYDDIPVVNLIPNTISPQEKHQGFTLLFDGKSSNNWRGAEPRGAPGTGWKIQDGAITVFASETNGPPQGKTIAMTEKQYGPFELKFEFKLHNPDAIAGIEYFVDGKSDGKRQALFGRLALDNAVHNAKINRDIWKKEWNQGVIKAHPNGLVEYFLNGYQILEYKRTDDQPSKGSIVIDAYNGDTVSYRSVKIRELK